MDRLTIRVTQEMIDIATQRHRGDCAVAIAIRLADDRLGWARVDRDQISISDRTDEVRRVWVTPARVRSFIDTFDLNRVAAQPFTFTLDPDVAFKVKPMVKTPPVPNPIRSPRGTSSNQGKNLSARSVVLPAVVGAKG